MQKKTQFLLNSFLILALSAVCVYYTKAGVTKTTCSVTSSMPYAEITSSIITLIDEVEKEKEEKKEEQAKNKISETKYVNVTSLNIRLSPNKKSKIIDTLGFNSKVLIVGYTDDKEWGVVEVDETTSGYIYTKYLSNKKTEGTRYSVPSYSGKKTWMPWYVNSGCIFSRSSNQYKLQQIAYTGNYGIRMVNGRYCVALGSHFNCTIGQYFDLILANGERIKCVMADAKSDRHTDSQHIFTLRSNCCTEFVVDTSALSKAAKSSGDISSCTKKWNSPVTTIIVYKKNALDF